MMIKAAYGNVTTDELVKGLYSETNWEGMRASEVWLSMN